MSDELTQVLSIATLALATGAIATWGALRMRLGGFQRIAADIIARAESEAETLQRKGEYALKHQQLEKEREIEQQRQSERQKLLKEDERLKAREDKLEQRLNALEKKLSELDKRDAALQADKKACDALSKEVAETKGLLLEQLEKASGLTATEAKDILLQRLHADIEADTLHLSRRRQKEAEESAEKVASSIIATAINRLCVPCVSDATLTTVMLPSDEMKGRIIGREGRNIRLLERELGVNILIDDTPGAVVLSGFDPIRKQIAKLVLCDLISDGRIHPTRIQESIERQRIEVQHQIQKFGEDAALRAGALDMDPALTLLLGQLKFRYSYGQNILDHSLEVSYLLGMMAAELGLDQRLAKRIGLLHDIGKAVSHEVSGSHAVIGHDLALKYGETAAVANGIGCHHHEMEPITIEGSLCHGADALSASRPGVRVGAVEEYIKRLKDLEEITHEFPGVERAYAMQAGREIQISVLPDVVDDNGLVNLARDISKRIEQKLNYPGRIKVTVMREKRAVDYAG